MSSIPLEEQQLSGSSFEDELKSTVDKILQACPMFRILVLGRETVVEHGRKAGESDIEREITSQQNPRLILHDSQGFSHADAGNFEIVQTFIEKRSKMTDLKDRLHAIWLCVEVPTYGGSLLEVGEEKILQLKNRGIPIVAVFTKYDMLVTSMLPKSVTLAANDDLYGNIDDDVDSLDDNIDHDIGSTIGVKESPIDVSFLRLADDKLRNEIIKPFEKTLDVPWVVVSVRPNFTGTLVELVKKTQACIDQSVGLVWAITQQQSVDVKIDAVIEIGKREYWRGLSTSLDIPGRSLAKWLKVIHRDIVKVWGLYDPDMVLSSAAIELSTLQEDLMEGSGTTWNVSSGAVTVTAALVSGIIPPAAPFALPIAAGIVFAAWVYKALKLTPNVLRGMMGYIVDLTIVMQSLFLLMQACRQISGCPSPVTQRLFRLALDAHKRDKQHSLQKVHEEIRSFATRARAILKPGEVIKEVERLIQSHRFKPSEVFMAEARAGKDSSCEAR